MENAEGKQVTAMEVRLLRAVPSDAQTIWRMQVRAFAPLLERYQDTQTSPANETPERVKRRLEQKETYYYLIACEGETVGAIRVVDLQDGVSPKRISPLFVLPEYQGKGIAQAAICEAERIHGKADWALETIEQERQNCYLYEKMGYRRTGVKTVVSEWMTLIEYRK